jgi:hypothetical protein
MTAPERRVARARFTLAALRLGAGTFRLVPADAGHELPADAGHAMQQLASGGRPT